MTGNPCNCRERERERERYNLTEKQIEEVSLGTIPKQARCKNLVKRGLPLMRFFDVFGRS